MNRLLAQEEPQISLQAGSTIVNGIFGQHVCLAEAFEKDLIEEMQPVSRHSYLRHLATVNVYIF